MFNRIKNLLSITLFLVAVSSCQKLRENPEGLSTPSNFYATPAQCEAALAGSMNILYSTWGGYQNQMLWPSGEYDGASLDFSSASFNEIWQWHYRALANINAVIKAIASGSLDGYAEKGSIEGQARFLRAFNYFMLVRLYGPIPYFDENSPDPVSTPLSESDRASVATVYDGMETDLLFAADNMDDFNAGTPGKPNKWVAKGLLAKVYITRATAPLNDASYYAKARDMADDVINNGPYYLLSDITQIFRTSNRNNMEIMFAFQSSDANQYMPGNVWAPAEMDGWGSGAVKIPVVNDPTYPYYYPEQPRKYHYILQDWTANIYDPGAPIINWTASSWAIPFVGKYNSPNLTYDEQVGGGDAHINIPILRFADILLIYAEAANMAANGPTQLAVDRLNMVIERANAPVGSDAYGNPLPPGTEALASIGMTRDQFDAKVINERFFELCFENDRYFDVLRKRILREVNEPDNAQGFDENDYLFPIPPLDAQSIGQNPGY